MEVVGDRPTGARHRASAPRAHARPRIGAGAPAGATAAMQSPPGRQQRDCGHREHYPGHPPGSRARARTAQPTAAAQRVGCITPRARLPRCGCSSRAARSPTKAGSARLAPGSAPRAVEGRRIDRDPLRREGVQAAELDEPAVHDRRARRHDHRDQPQGRDPRDHAARGAPRHRGRARRRPRAREGRRGSRAPAADRGARRRAARRLRARAPRVPDRHRPDRPAVPRRRRPRGRSSRSSASARSPASTSCCATRSASTAIRSSRRPRACSSRSRSSPRRVYAESKGVACVEIDLARLRGDLDPALKLF